MRVLTRTTVIGAFDHGIYGAVERVSDHIKTPDPESLGKYFGEFTRSKPYFVPVLLKDQ